MINVYELDNHVFVMETPLKWAKKSQLHPPNVFLTMLYDFSCALRAHRLYAVLLKYFCDAHLHMRCFI